jgi:ATP-binding cassette, subfamily C, bacterial CydD
MPASPIPNAPRLHRRLGAECRASARSLVPGIAIVSLLSAIITVGQMYCLSQIIDGAFLQAQSLTALLPWMHGLLGLITTRALLLWIGEIIAQRGAAQIKAQLRNRLFRHVLHLGPAWSGREQSGELVATAVDGIEKLDDYFARFVPAKLAMGLIPPLLVLCVFVVDPLSGVVLCITGPLIPIFMILIGKRAESATRQQWEALSRLGAHFLDVLQGIKTLKVFGQSKAQGDRIRAVSDRYRKATMDVLKVAFLSGFVLELAASISTAVVAVEIGVRLIEGYIAFQPGLFVLLLAPEFYLPFRTLGARHHAGMEGVAAADRIYEILDTEPKSAITGGAGRAPDRPRKSGWTIFPTSIQGANSQPSIASPPSSNQVESLPWQAPAARAKARW